MRQRLLTRLAEHDAGRREQRAERIEWLALHEVNPPAVLGRTESLHLLAEAREVFFDGHFAATLLVALSFIEHTVVEELQDLGHVTGSPTFSEALTISAAKLVFPADWLVRAKTLSLRRNPFVHLKPDDHKHGLGARVREEKRRPKTILEEDAKDSIDLMYSFFQATLRPGALNLPNE
jgi:hypothetical protein